MASVNLNKVLLMGNLTRDPELRYTPTGTAVVQFGLANSRRFKSQTDEWREETLFVDVTAFGRRAEVIAEHMKKGRPIFVEGRLKLDQWTTQDGQKRSRLTVVAEQFQFVDSKAPARAEGGGGERGREPTQSGPELDLDDEVPF